MPKHTALNPGRSCVLSVRFTGLLVLVVLKFFLFCLAADLYLARLLSAQQEDCYSDTWQKSLKTKPCLKELQTTKAANRNQTIDVCMEKDTMDLGLSPTIPKHLAASYANRSSVFQ